MERLNVFIFAHNNMQTITLLCKVLQMRENVYINIMDNYSNDGLAQWLATQENMNYVVCDDKPEGYGTLLRCGLESFYENGDVLVLDASTIVFPNTIAQLEVVTNKYPKAMLFDFSILEPNEDVPNYSAANTVASAVQNEELVLFESLMVDRRGFYIREELVMEYRNIFAELFTPNGELLYAILACLKMGKKAYHCHNLFAYSVGYKDYYRDAFKYENERVIFVEKWDMNYFNSTANEFLMEHIEKTENEMNVLEIGCDCGANLLGVKRRCPNAHLYGVEINPTAANIARNFFEVSENNLEEQELPYESEFFDYILFGDVLEHLRNPEAALKYCRKLLKPTGKIIASIPNLMNYSVMRELLNGRFTYTDMGLLDKTHIHFFTYYEIVVMLQRSGYEVDMVNYNGGIANEEDADFVHKLASFSENTEEFMFVAFQYQVVASVKKE